MAAATAAAAPRSSSNGSANSYIGSLISLTSKSEIRYEGILFNINAEESSIGLRNVRSFGTEGRKKDGPQVPPSDKIYEYILFRGSDIKDLQVKSSPTVQTVTPVHNDPAIIQTHYPQDANSSSSGIGSILDVGSQNLQTGLPRPTFQGNLPLYRPVGGLGSWGSSPPPPTTNGSGLALPPMYWQGFYGSSNGFQSQQQSLVRPPPGLSLPPSLQQTMQYPSLSMPLPSGASNMPALKSSEPPSALLPPNSSSNLNLKPSVIPSSTAFWQSSVLPTSIPSLQSSVLPTSNPSLQSSILPTSNPSLQSSILPTSNPSLQSSILPAQSALNTGTLNLQPPLLPAQTSVMVSDLYTNSVPNKAHSEALPSVASSVSLSQASSSTISFNKNTLLSPVSDKHVSIGMPVKTSESFSVAGLSEASSITGTSSSILNERTMPSLITPGQLLQPGPTTVSSTQSLQTSKKDVQSVQVSLGERSATTDSQDPLLPLPSPSEYKTHGGHMLTHHYNRGRGRGRGNRISRPMARFTEDFDFTAMNEKFNKDEVWGDIGKSSKEEENDLQEDDESSKPESKHVYVKDDFFDSLSCDALDRGSSQGRTRLSEQFRKDTETFGHIPRHRGGRGGRGLGGGGRSSGGYYGRGYGYGHGHGYGYIGRGRGHNFYGRDDQ